STEIQRQCEGKMISSILPMFSTDFAAQDLYTALARNMTMRVRRPLQGTLRKKIRSYATQLKKVKKTREPNCFLRSCAREKRNQSRKRYQNMSQSQRRRQNQKRR
uniref:Uncharacterized protein n=1 Tax=Capra hircus TaxID=9925 RepID=A0A8C2S1Y0_CAPHI